MSKAPALPDIPGYDVEAEIGRGGMGVVYKVRQHKHDRVLALKMILRGRQATFPELARFRIEAEAMACLNHPNIIKIRDVGVFSGFPYFALEYAEKGSLHQVTQGEPQPVAWSARLVETLASAMQHAHGRRMLHRDLKPANILIAADGTPKISDFGLVKFAGPMEVISGSYCTMSISVLDEELRRFAREMAAQYESASDATWTDEDALTCRIWEECARRTGALGHENGLQSVMSFLEEMRGPVEPSPSLDELTQSGSVMGSPIYMAPEQASGNLERIGPPTDIYALGGILYELLTGQTPFAPKAFPMIYMEILSRTPTPPRQIEPAIPAEIEAICLKCLEKDPRRRFQKAADLADALKPFYDSHTSLANNLPTNLHSSNPHSRDSQGVDSSQSQPEPDSRDKPKSTRRWWPFQSRQS
jgi:serine/threonine protein kinase